MLSNHRHRKRQPYEIPNVTVVTIWKANLDGKFFKTILVTNKLHFHDFSIFRIRHSKISKSIYLYKNYSITFACSIACLSITQLRYHHRFRPENIEQAILLPPPSGHAPFAVIFDILPRGVYRILLRGELRINVRFSRPRFVSQKSPFYSPLHFSIRVSKPRSYTLSRIHITCITCLAVTMICLVRLKHKKEKKKDN